MVSKDPQCICVRLFKCLGLCKNKAQEDHELITIRARSVPIIPPTRTQTIVPESSAGTKTRKLSIALPSKRTKQELSNDTVSNWFENLINTDQSSGNLGEPSTKDTSNLPEEALTKDASDQEEASTKDVHSHSGEVPNKDTSNQPEEASIKDTSSQPEEASTKDASDKEEASTKDVHSHSGEASNKNTSDQSPQAI
ncbi:uncharacterized protein FIESC28_08336 [Fusarium coffeatum]|uniref:Uncharacterized protein n=1 Tax=Fusarium coffeatum TaxID=231269 RepID=A0A366RA14_9HYPO|nr:uncharacterized protein FIESC28_08336 [Fusarium coffeatum]RBR13150.1 hypothetical protein FIESC28_08336 [Fusarium coffeatum]